MKNIAKSIRERLLNLAKAQDQNFNTLLTQYALQRLLYRLSISDYHHQFVLKGAWFFVVINNTALPAKLFIKCATAIMAAR